MNRLEIVDLYLKDTIEFLEDNEFFKDICNEDGIEDIRKFKESFIYELKLKILDAYDKRNSPELTEDEFLDVTKSSIVEYHLESLKDKGLIQSELDLISGEVVYSLNRNFPPHDNCEYGMYDH